MRAGSRAENLQNQARTVDDLGVQVAFQIALLNRRERRVDYDDVNFQRLYQVCEPIDYSGPEQGRRSNAGDRYRLRMRDFQFYRFGQRNTFRQARLRVSVPPRAAAIDRIKG